MVCASVALGGCANDESSMPGPGAGSTGGNIIHAPPLDLAGVVWLDEDVSGWPETVVLSGVSLPEANLCVLHSLEDRAWPTAQVNDQIAVANAWVFIQHDGAWQAAVWEWVAAEPSLQKCFGRTALDGDHINLPPFNMPPFAPPAYWLPQPGDTLYFMVSGFVRGGITNVEERTNVVGIVWP